MAISLEYTDSIGEVSNRRIIVKAISVVPGTPYTYIDGWCLLRDDWRRFRSDRILTLSLPPSWSPVGDPDEFLRRYLPENAALTKRDARGSPQAVCRDGLAVLMYVARSDGDHVPEQEVDAIRQYISAALDRASIRNDRDTIEQIVRYAETLYPTAESMHQYLRRLEADDGSLAILVPALTRLVKADNSYTESERHAVATLLREIETIRDESARGAVSEHSNLQNIIGEFVAVDVETANSNIGSICSIGLVHFRDGNITKQLKLLVNPECDFDPMNVSIHGIRPDDVKTARVMRDIFPVISSSLSNLYVVHHTHFDRSALRQVAEQHGFDEIDCRWIDSASVARRAWKRFSVRGYGLKNLAEEFSIDFKHHDACEDARVAGLIFLRAIAETGISVGDWHGHVSKAASESVSPSVTPEAQRIAGVVTAVTSAKREERLDEAVELLLEEIKRQEVDAIRTGLGVAPWYYEQLAIVYRKLKQHDDELAVLERYDQQPKAPGAGPKKLKDRLDKVRRRIAKRELKEARASLQ